MGDNTILKERPGARVSPIYDLIWQDERTRRELFLEASDRTETDKVARSQLLQCVNIRPVGDLAR